MLPVGDHIVRHLSISLDLALFGDPFLRSPGCSQRWSAGAREVLSPCGEPQGDVGFPSAFRRDGEGEGRGGGGREGGWGRSTTGVRGRRVPSPSPRCSRGSHTLLRPWAGRAARAVPEGCLLPVLALLWRCVWGYVQLGTNWPHSDALRLVPWLSQ